MSAEDDIVAVCDRKRDDAQVSEQQRLAAAAACATAPSKYAMRYKLKPRLRIQRLAQIRRVNFVKNVVEVSAES